VRESLATAAGYWLPSAALVSARVRRLFGVRATINRDDAVALTFDDGPHREGTPAILAALERAQARATFFLVGEQVERSPELAAEVAAAGHEIGVHCQQHRNLMRLTPRQVREDLDRAADVIANATGRELRVYRPPYGILTMAALAYARNTGWEVFLWRRAGKDWDARATPDSIAARIVRRLAPGDVILLHDADHYSAADSWRRTAGALGLLLRKFEQRGLVTAPLG
jgi:peptidoglycan/xylan/chitin deacetylase (PgdA/CDA1 family)